MEVSQDEQAALATLLAGIPLFAPMDEKSLARVAKGAERLETARGTTLFSSGDPADGLHAVVAGRVKLALQGSDRAEKVVALIGPGGAFGEAALFVGEPHIVSAVTLTAATLVRIAKPTILACMRRDSEFALHVAAALSRKLRDSIRETGSAALRSGTQRTVSFILGELPPIVAGGATLTLPAKKRIIASRLDLTQEHFSRILHDLAAANLIVVQGARVMVPDVPRLRAFNGSREP